MGEDGKEQGRSMSPLAHVTEHGRLHLLSEHLQAVANLAAGFAECFGGAKAAYLAGRWHDLGKYSAVFQDMILRANGFDSHIEPRDAQGPRDHSSAGAVHATKALGAYGFPIAFAIAGHHAGLANKADLQLRLREKTDLLDSAIAGGAPPSLLAAECEDVSPPFEVRDARSLRRLELWIRMLFSALVDADFLDTEHFFDSARAELRQGRPRISVLQQRLMSFMDGLQEQAPDTHVNRVRRRVRSACEEAAVGSSGVFTLTAPTGAGKTLASMCFAMAHAEANELRRVVVAVPFTSIIEQNAEVYRRAMGDDAVLEHHSSLDPHKETAQNRVACENWDAPVVVTTTVQLLESLFASRTSRCRKLHRLARSVIILDEVQSLPPGLLESIVDALSALSEDHGASIVLSTATQPALCSDVVRDGFRNPREILPSGLDLFASLKRVRVEWPGSDDEVTTYAELGESIAGEPSALCIVHRREDARELCQRLDTTLGNTETRHLSALMCAEHRSKVLAEIRKLQSKRTPIRCVSTQLVEAGVDLDFPVVFRALAGLDALAQAAGRCNREGKLGELGRLVVFRAETAPPKGVLQTAHGIASLMLKMTPSLDIFDPDVHLEFFSRLYGSLDQDRFDIQRAREQLRFRDVSENFSLIENDWAVPVALPYGAGAARIRDFSERGPSRGRLRALQRYSVNVARRYVDSWLASGFCTWVHDAVIVLDSLWMSAYDDRFGLVPDQVGVAAPTQLIF